MKRSFLLLSVLLLAFGAQAAIKTYQWNMVGEDYETRYNEVLSKSGYTVDDLTLYGAKVGSTDFAAVSTNGAPMYGYLRDGGTEEINQRYFKITLPKGSIDTLHWIIRTGANGNRDWYLYYNVLDADSTVTESLLKNAVNYYTLNSATAYVCDSLPNIVLDLTKAQKDQTIYFFFQCFDGTSMKKNNMAFRILDLKMMTEEKDTNTTLSKVYYEGIEYPATATVLYGNIANVTAQLTGVAESLTSKVDTIVVTNPTTKGAAAQAELVVTAESGKKQTYTYTILGAEFKTTTFDYCLLENKPQQDSILAAKDYKVSGMVMKLIPGTSNCNFGDATKPGLYIRQAGGSYGDCGMRITLPKESIGVLNFTMRPGNANYEYQFYGLMQDMGTAVPTGWSAQGAMDLGGFVAGSATSIVKKFVSPILDLSAKEVDQDLYIYQLRGGLRWQYVAYTQFITVETPTALTSESAVLPRVEKMLINGQMIIKKNNALYNLQGINIK